MARQKRYHLSGGFYHVMLRGNFGQDIFFSDSDRYNMLFLLQEGVEKFDHRIHSYCFMKNHIHLLIQTGTIPLSKIMQNIAFRYSQKINQKLGRQGRLFQGRFKSILIKEEVYFTRLLRYIHTNPVRAKITRRPENYIWSSHNSYLGQNSISWLTTDYGLSKFAQIKKEAILFYSTYVLKEESPDELSELRMNFKDSQVLGDDNFLDQIRNKNAIQISKPLPLKAIIEATSRILEIEKDLII